MELEKAKNMAIKLMAKHGLIELGWSFRFDNAKRRYGCCFYNRRVISLSNGLTKIREDTHVKNTILHEIAHAIVGPSNGHNRVWKKKAVEIGCTGHRCSNDAKLEGKWIGTCPAGHIHYRHREPKVSSSCTLCCKVYNPAHKITYRLNQK
jgi:hypothetical protein